MYYVNSTIGDRPELGAFAPSFGEGMRGAFSSMTGENVTTLLWDAGRLKQANAVDKPRLSVDEVRQRFMDAGVTENIPASGYTAEAVEMLIDRRREQAALQSVRDRTAWSWIGSPVRGAAMLFAGAMDPLNVASAFIPVVGQARSARMIQQAGVGAFARAGARAQIGAIEGAAGALMLEPFVYGLHQSLQDQYTMADSLMNVAFGATLGAGLHTGAGAVRDVLSPQVGTAPILTREGAAVTPNAEVPFARLAETMDPDTRMAAFRIAMAEMVEGRLPDVRSLFDAIGQSPVMPAVDSLDLNSTKVVDQGGKPMLVYHGTDQAFDTFAGGMFTSNRARAENYAMGSKGRVLEAHLNITNPMPWADAFGKSPDEIKAAGFDGTIQFGSNGQIMRAVVVDAAQVVQQPTIYPTAAPTLSPLAAASRQAMGAERARVAFDSAMAARTPPEAPRGPMPVEKADPVTQAGDQMTEASEQLAATIKALEARGVSVAADLAPWDEAITRARNIGKGLEAVAACRVGG